MKLILPTPTEQAAIRQHDKRAYPEVRYGKRAQAELENLVARTCDLPDAPGDVPYWQLKQQAERELLP